MRIVLSGRREDLKDKPTAMIISASRRTDIPAFYAEWFMNRIRAGFCDVPNPVNPSSIARISLLPEDVDAVVFWTRHPGPLLEHLDELDRRGFRSYFQFTLLGYPKILDPAAPPRNTSVETFRALTRRIGPDRVVWRYDPIVFSNLTPESRHLDNFRDLASSLAGCTRRVVVSLMDVYPFVEKRLRRLEFLGLQLASPDARPVETFITRLTRIAAEAGLEILGCAEGGRLEQFGIPPGKCIDDALIERVFKIHVPGRKDPGQRPACRCIVSRDIGIYDTCPMGCIYCYATRDSARARQNYRNHDPRSSSLAARAPSS